MNSREIRTDYSFAGALCLFGLLLRVLFSDPLLNAIGFHYSGDTGAFYEKIHPGSYFIVLSFAALLVGIGNPVRALLRIYNEQKSLLILLLLYLLILAFLVLRSGPQGTAFIVDAHLMVPMAAIVLCYTPPGYCRKAALCFLLIAATNSAIGLGEGLTKTRLLAFDPDWSVLHEEYFRASALLGHPLVNATVTVIAMFVTAAMRIPTVLKSILLLLFTASLVAFGSRAALAVGLAGLAILGAHALRHRLFYQRMTMQRIFGLIVLVIIVPLGLIGFLILLIHGGLGERLVAAAHWDQSANSRVLAFQALHQMYGEEMFLGMPVKRMLEITERLNSGADFGSIENPWLIMFMYLGLVWFLLWLEATVVFVLRLLRGQAFPVQLAVLGYFVIASTFNSFGTKDATYLIMVAAVICASRSALSAYSKSAS